MRSSRPRGRSVWDLIRPWWTQRDPSFREWARKWLTSRGGTRSRPLQPPVFVDFLQDETRSRTVAAGVFLLVITIVVHMLLIAFLRSPANLEGEARAVRVELVQQPKPSIVLGKTLYPDPFVRLTNFEGFPVRGIECALEIASIRFDDFPDFDCSVRASENMLLDDRRFQHRCEGNLSQSTMKSNHEGYAAFAQVSLHNGFAGVYNFRVSCGADPTGKLLSVDFQVAYSSTVGTLSLLTGLPGAGPFLVGDALPEIRVQVLDFNQLPLPGIPVFIMTEDLQFTQEELGYTMFQIEDQSSHWVPDPSRGKYATLSGNQAISGEDGIATFSNVRALGITHRYQYFVLDAQGVKLPLFEDLMSPLMFNTTIALVEIIVYPPARAVEGRRISPQPVVQVKDRDGSGIEGKLCFARDVYASGLRRPPFGKAMLYGRLKEITGVVSTTSDSAGYAHFEDLSFTTSGPVGASNFIFVCDGVESSPTEFVYAETSVAKVSVTWNPQGVVLAGETINPVPAIQILDETGAPLSGKIPAVYGPEELGASILPTESTDDGIASVEMAFTAFANASLPYQVAFCVDQIACATTRTFYVDYPQSMDEINPLSIQNVVRDPGKFAVDPRLVCSRISIVGPEAFVVDIGQPFTVRMQLFDGLFEPAEGFQATITTMIGLPGNVEVRVSNTSLHTVDKPFVADGDGIVEFPLVVAAGYPGSFVLNGLGWGGQFFCFSLPVFIILEPTVSPSGISIVNELPKAVSTGSVVDVDVRVTDIYGNVTAGRSVSLAQGPEPLYTLYLRSWENETVPSSVIGETVKTTQALTDEDGIATVQLQFPEGFPGTYKFGVIVDGMSGPIIEITALNKVVSIEPVDIPTNLTADGLFGVQPSVRLLDESTQPVAGYRAFAFLFNFANDTRVVDIFDGTLVFPGSAEADEDGLAVFEGPPGRYGFVFMVGTEEDQNVVWSANPTTNQSFVWNAALKVEEVKKPSAVASFGSGFAVPPSIRVMKRGAGKFEELGAFVGRMEIKSHPRGGSGEIVGNIHASNAAVGTFSDFMIQRGMVGEYEFNYHVPGAPLLSTEPILVTDQPSLLAITQQPPDVVTIGEVFSVAVSARIESGAPVKNRPVVAELVEISCVSDPCNGMLTPARTVNSTAIDGIAFFTLLMPAGSNGTYALRFKSFSIYSRQTSTFEVLNPLTQMVVVRAPGVAHGSSVQVTGNERENVQSMQQPIVRLFGYSKDVLVPFSGRQVFVRPLPEGKGGKLKYSIPVTDEEGRATFHDLQFTDGNSGTYSLEFIVDGVAFREDTEFSLQNKLRPDTSQFANAREHLILFLLICLPIFMGNSTWNPPVIVFLGFLGSLIYPIILIIDVVRALEDGQERVAFDVTLKVILVLNAFFVLFSAFYILYVFFYPEHAYDAQKMEQYETSVRKVLFGPRIPTPFWHPPKPRNWKERVLFTLIPPKPPKPPTYYTVFFYPQRFLFSAAVSMYFLIIGIIISAVCVSWMDYEVGQGLKRLLNAEVEGIQLYDSAKLAPYTSNFLDGITMAATSLIRRDSLRMAAQEGHSVGAEILSDTTDVIAFFRNALTRSGYAAITIAAILFIAVWQQMFLKFRSNALRARKGKLRIGYDRTHFSLASSLSYMGAQAGASLLGLIASFLVIWIILLGLAYEPIRDFMWTKARVQVIGVASMSVLSVLGVEAMKRYFIVDGWNIKNRYLYCYFELFFVFFNFVKGLMLAVIRLVMALLQAIILFPRLDMPLLFGRLEEWDRSHMAYRSMLLADARYNAPVFYLASNYWMQGLFERRRAKEDGKPMKLPSRHVLRWQLAYMLLKMPSLVLSGERRQEGPKEEKDREPGVAFTSNIALLGAHTSPSSSSSLVHWGSSQSMADAENPATEILELSQCNRGPVAFHRGEDLEEDRAAP